MFIKSLIQKTLIGVCVFDALGVAGSDVREREWKGVRGLRRRNATDNITPTISTIKIPGLENLQSYVCPTNSILAARQATSISLSSTDLVSLFQQLEAILSTLETILKAQGLYTSALSPIVQTTTSVNAAGSSVVITTTAPRITQPVLENSAGLVYVTVTATTTVFADAAPTSTLAPTTLQPSPSTSAQAIISLSPSIVTIGTTIVSTQQTVVSGGNGQPTTISSTYVMTSVSTSTYSSLMSTAAQSTYYDDDCEDEPAETVTVTNVVASSTANTANVAASSTTASGAVFVATSVSTGYSSVATSTSGYVFNSQANTNVAAYFGQTPVTSGSSLLAQCADPSIDIAILAFVVSNNYQGSSYPLVNYGAACGGQTAAMIASAPGLLSCPDLATMISTCHTQYGKKVMMSIGGSASGISFTAASQATDFANVLWKLFGPPGLIDINLRPFGNVSIDGFDIDNEDNLPANFDVLGVQLKANYANDTTKSYYLSSAPQCPFPDASDPGALILNCDFVFVQFYNNAPCEIGSTGFNASLAQWSTYLQTSTNAVKPKLYIGAPAWSAAGPSAYANIGSAQGMYKVAQQVRAQNLPNLGGIMFWDGAEGMLNTESGKDIITWAKSGLTS